MRIGTAEIYAEVEKIPEVADCVAVGQDWEGDVRVVLFVALREGAVLDEGLIAAIKTGIRRGSSPRHVPARILAVPDIPRTRTGKVSELAVRDAVHGRPVLNLEALANPEALEHFHNLPQLTISRRLPRPECSEAVHFCAGRGRARRFQSPAHVSGSPKRQPSQPPTP